MEPIDEIARLRELHALNILDTPAEEHLDRFTRLIADIFKVRTVALSLVDADRQWFKSIVGCSLRQTTREESICTHALNLGYLEIPDLLEDPFFQQHPALAADPKIRFYAGVVIFGPTAKPIGTLCLSDGAPRRLKNSERRRLEAFARIMQHEINNKAAQEKERQISRDSALRDSTTGLPGEVLLNQILEGLIATAETAQRQLAVVHLRVQNLTAIADLDSSYSPNTMIQVLVDRVFGLPEEILNASRVGAEKLVLVLPAGPTGSSKKTTLRVVKRIQERLTEPVELDDRRIRPEISIGISLYPSDGIKARPLIEMARRAVGHADAHHKIRFYDAITDASTTRRVLIEERLEGALIHNQISLHYQPIWLADGSRVTGFEALARWQDGKLGVVGPNEFVPVAEKNSLLSHLLTCYVLRMACAEAQGWQMSVGEKPLRIAVNIPAREFYRPGFAATVFKILEETGLEPRRLTLELTEESLVQDIDQTIRTMAKLSAQGIKLALDDFGTGYSSLNHLSRLPVDILKIDKSFIDSLPGQGRMVEFVSGFIKIVHALELTIVAEGVEHESQRAMLADMHCDMIQGYLLGRPMAPEKIPELLESV